MTEPSGQGWSGPPVKESEPPPHQRTLRADVQGLRGVAVLLVVLYHAGLPLHGGFIGVDVFFVISGFVITGLLSRELTNGTFRFRSFYSRRVRRLVPALAVTTSMTALLAILLLSPFGPQQITGQTGIGATLIIANLVIPVVSGGYFNLSAETNALLNTWSLSVEEQFYLVFPLILMLSFIGLAKGLHRRRTAIVVSVVMVTSFALSLAMSSASLPWLSESRQQTLAFFLSPTRAWEFAVGSLIAVLASDLRRIHGTIRVVLGWTGFMIILTSAIVINGQSGFPGTAALWPVGGAALVIAAGTGGNSGLGFLDRGPMVWIGDRSYSWYLWHWPIIVFAAAWFPESARALSTAAAFSLFPAWCSYRWIETRYRAQSGRQNSGKTIHIAAVCLLVPIVACSALLVGSRNGWGSDSIRMMGQQIEPLHADSNNGCDRPLLGPQLTSAECSWNRDSAAEPIYLVGDSKAGQWIEGAIQAARAQDRPLFLSIDHGCPFLVGLVTLDGVVQETCTKSTQTTLETLSDAKPGVVYIAQSGDYVNGDAYGLGSPAQGASREPQAKVSVMQAGLVRQISQLREAGHRVVLIQDNASFAEWSVARCPTWKAASNSANCGATVSELAAREYRQPMASAVRAAAESADAKVVDPLPRLCSGGSCSTNEGQFWRMRDAVHVTVGQSELMAWMFTPDFRSG